MKRKTNSKIRFYCEMYTTQYHAHRQHSCEREEEGYVPVGLPDEVVHELGCDEVRIDLEGRGLSVQVSGVDPRVGREFNPPGDILLCPPLERRWLKGVQLGFLVAGVLSAQDVVPSFREIDAVAIVTRVVVGGITRRGRRSAGRTRKVVSAFGRSSGET